MPWASTYDLIAASARAHADQAALTFLHSAQPGGAATCWTYRELLQGIHQTANALHGLQVGPQDVTAILLPGGLTYHLALWGGEAAGIVQPLNPLLSEEKLLSLLHKLLLLLIGIELAAVVKVLGLTELLLLLLRHSHVLLLLHLHVARHHLLLHHRVGHAL
jgi:acyl-CoA synthetase (AMP-forming)/AMP-acid ligase II